MINSDDVVEIGLPFNLSKVIPLSLTETDVINPFSCLTETVTP